MAVADFELAILTYRWPDGVDTHRADSAAPRLHALDAERPLHTIVMEHVDRYDWDRQTLQLNEAGTRAIAGALAGVPAADAAVPAMRRRLGWGNALEHGLHMRCFRVLAAGRVLYRGLFLDATSQRVVVFPVARIGLYGERACISVLPVHIPFALEDPIGEDGSRRRVPPPPEAISDLEQLAAHGSPLDAFINGIATSAEATRFRRLIRDGTLREQMDRAGKLGPVAPSPDRAAD